MCAQLIIDQNAKECDEGKIAFSKDGTGTTGYHQLFFKKDLNLQGRVKISLQL